jgi:hypothetical protein
MQHRAISIGRDQHSTLTFLFLLWLSLVSLSPSLPRSLTMNARRLFRPLFRACTHRAYQWNFRTAADASGDDINTHIVLFITSGFLLLLLRAKEIWDARTHLHRRSNRYIFSSFLLFRLMSKNINFELARDKRCSPPMSFQSKWTIERIVVKTEAQRNEKRRSRSYQSKDRLHLCFICHSSILFSLSRSLSICLSPFVVIESRPSEDIFDARQTHRCLSNWSHTWKRTMSSFVKS